MLIRIGKVKRMGRKLETRMEFAVWKRPAKCQKEKLNRAKTYDQWKQIKCCQSKVKYKDDLSAIHAALMQSRHHGPCRWYHCETCNGYHITTQVR